MTHNGDAGAVDDASLVSAATAEISDDEQDEKNDSQLRHQGDDEELHGDGALRFI